MAGYIRSKTKRAETTALNTKVNKQLLDEFKSYCKELGCPMNVLIETFMKQYLTGEFCLNDEDIVKWKKDKGDKEVLNTTFSKEIYHEFRDCCKDKGFYLKHILCAFMEKIITKEYRLMLVKK